MKFILELNQKEIDALKKANTEVKNVFAKIKNTFQVRVVNTDKDKSKRKK